MSCYSPLAGIKKVWISTVTGDSVNYFITTGQTIVISDPLVFKEYEFADGTYKESWTSSQQGVTYNKQFDFTFSDFTDQSIFNLEGKNMVVVFQDLDCKTFIVGHDRTFSVNKSEASDSDTENKVDFSITQISYSRKQLLDKNFNLEYTGDWFTSTASQFNLFNPTGQSNFTVAFWYKFTESLDSDEVIVKRDTQYIIGKSTDGIYFKTSSDGISYGTGITTTLQLSANTQYFVACYKSTNQGSIFIYNHTDGQGQTVSSTTFGLADVTGSTFELSAQNEVKGLGIWNTVDTNSIDAINNNGSPPAYSGLTALYSGLTNNLIAYYEIPTFEATSIEDSSPNNLDLTVSEGNGTGGVTFDSNCNLGGCECSGGGSSTGGTTYTAGDGINITANVISVELAPSSGLEFSSGNLRIIPNQFVAIGAFNTYSGVTASLINSKLSTSTFNSYTGSTASILNSKLNTSVFNSYTGSSASILNNAVTGGTNLATTGNAVFSSKVGRNLTFKSLVAGDHTNIISTSTGLTIYSTISGETFLTTRVIVTGTTYTVTNAINKCAVFFTNPAGCLVLLDQLSDPGLSFTSYRANGAGVITHTGSSVTLYNPNGNKNITIANGAIQWLHKSSTEWYGYGVVDVATGGTTTLASNGLSKVGDTIILGGTLTSSTEILGGGTSSLSLGTSASRLSSLNVFPTNGVLIQTNSTSSSSSIFRIEDNLTGNHRIMYAANFDPTNQYTGNTGGFVGLGSTGAGFGAVSYALARLTSAGTTLAILNGSSPPNAPQFVFDAVNQLTTGSILGIDGGVTGSVVGSNTATGFYIKPNLNYTNGSHRFIGIDYNPTLTSTTGLAHNGIIIRPSGATNGFGVSTPTATVDVVGSSTTRASLRLRAGTAPTSPNDGDIWFDGTALKMRVTGVTKTFTLT